MDEVYNLHRYTHFVVFCIRENTTASRIYSTSTRETNDGNSSLQNDNSYIIYDKQKSKVLSFGKKYDNEDEDTLLIDVSGKKLYQLFKKGEDSWNEDDRFLFKAISDYINLYVESLLQDRNRTLKQVEDTEELHYLFVVPSEWEEEIREVLIRPLFVRANLISKDDHKDRLLFCTDLESIYYYATEFLSNSLELSRNTIIGVIGLVEENKVSIKLDSILIGNPLFDFSKSLLFPKLMASYSSFLTTDDVKNGIKEFMKIKFSFNAQEETIQNIMEATDHESSRKLDEYLEKPFITDKSISELDKKHATLIKSIRPIDICAEISKKLPNNLKLLLPNDLGKEYSLFRLTANYQGSKVNRSLLHWSEYMLDYNRISSSSNYITLKRLWNSGFGYQDVLKGAVRYMFDALQNSDVYSKPSILSTENSATSSSIFLKSKPDAILNIDILLESTALSYSLLDENGLVKQIWDHDYFVHDIPLRSLGSFFSFSEVTTLNVKSSFINMSDISNKKRNGIIRFIKSVKEHLKDKSNIFSNLSVSTQQQVYIEEFLSAITANSMLLKRLFGTEDDLRDIIYASNLVQKDDSYRKFRIATHAEGLFPVIQQSFNLQFPVKSFFVVAQLYENYVQLTLNQVVTEPGLENEYQEAIIMQEEMIPIPNIYDNLCINMWSNITEDSSTIQLCDTHERYEDYELLEIFTLKNQAEFTNNLKEFISKNILNKTLNEQTTDIVTISLSTSCNCRVRLTVNDITEISFRPILQYIISIVFTSLINKQLFGKYRNIQYVFHLIRFNYNPQFQRILMKILEDETDHFLYEERIDVAHYTLPKSSNQLLRPVRQQKPSSYKAFQVGVLYQVHCENYGFGIDTGSGPKSYEFKNKISDSKITSIDKETVLPLFEKGHKINSAQIKRVFYLSSNYKNRLYYLKTQLLRLKNTDTLSFDKTVRAEDPLESINGPTCSLTNCKQDRYIPFIISVLYEGHSSTLSLALQIVGDEIAKKCITIAEPMTLARF
ncbi:hypothetical protein MFLAVUS_001904 [Mucor flavus]|uniref:Uncharacterized protein n=1 Tax=Mucor flavus TaxID=439312 RepID=A0ABP9YNT1_9FUNG